MFTCKAKKKKKKKKRKGLSHELLPKKLSVMLFFFIFRKWAMRNMGILLVFLAQFFLAASRPIFSWQLKESQKSGSAPRAMWQKSPHTYTRGFVRQTFCFSWPKLSSCWAVSLLRVQHAPEAQGPQNKKLFLLFIYPHYQPPEQNFNPLQKKFE